MNERIRQLAEQAGLSEGVFTRHHGIPCDLKGYSMLPDEMEKFAELIVRECMRQVEEQYLPVLEDETMMKDTHWGGYVQCGVDSYVAIREHFFGVEE
jgi:hypothetical protein